MSSETAKQYTEAQHNFVLDELKREFEYQLREVGLMDENPGPGPRRPVLSDVRAEVRIDTATAIARNAIDLQHARHGLINSIVKPDEYAQIEWAFEWVTR